MNRLKTVIVLVLLLATSFSILIPTVSNAASPTSYVTITLTNSQTTATPENFTQLLKVNWSAYATDLNANISNVRLYNSTTFSASTELAGWIEDNNTTTATSSNVWVNLSDTIVPASGTVDIYMAFLPASSSWSSHWGLAPQLSTVYGAIDNGKKVFEYYQSFGSLTALPSPWVMTYNGASSGVAETNYYCLDGTTAQLGITTSVNYNVEGLTVDFAAIIPLTSATSGTAMSNGFGTANADGTYFVGNYGGYISAGTQGRDGAGGGYGNWGTSGEWADYSAGTQVSTSQRYLDTMQVYSTGTTSTSVYYEINYTQQESTTSSPGSYSLPLTFVDSGFNIPIYWIRMRYTPPDGEMPSISFGSIVKISTTGYQISFKQTSLPSGTKWGIRLNNTTSTTWLNSTNSYDNFTGLLNGTYTYQVINATGYNSNPYSGILTINGANLSQTITFTGYAIASTESGLPQGDTWYLNLSNQPGLSESDTGQHLSSTSTTIDFKLPNGTYSYTYQTSNHNYKGGVGSLTVSGSTSSFNVVFNPVLYYLNFTALDKPSYLEWGVNVSGTIKTGYGDLLSFSLANGTYYWNASAINGSFNDPIGYYRLTNGSGTVLLHNETTFKGLKIIINGKNYNNNITFARAYNITFEEVGISNSFQWDVNLSNGLGITLYKHIIISDNVTQVFFNSTEGNYTNGTYPGSIELKVQGSTGTRYINLTAQSALSEVINGNNMIYAYNFITQYFLTTEALPVNGGYVSPYSGWLNASSQVQLTASPNASYEFTGFEGYNTSSYSGMGYYSSGQYISMITMTNPITEVMDFSNYLVLTFYMENLTIGTKWGVELTDQEGLVQWNNGTGYYIVFDIQAGTYSYTITGVGSTPQSDIISVSSSIKILLEYNVKTYDVNFKEIGLQPGTNWNIAVFSDSFSYSVSKSTSIINFELPNGTYTYTASSVYGYITNNSSKSFNVKGNSILIYVNWTEGNPLILEGIRHFVPIYLNTSDFTIQSGIQVPININWSKYSNFENYNLSNVIFMNATFYPLYAWIETNATSNQKDSIVWVKINSGIAYNSSIIVYLAFQSKNSNNFNKYGYLGEASQLSPLYGEFDNIAMVMNKGLITQIYVNTSATSSDISVNPLLNANYSQGTNIYENGVNFKATSGYFLTPFQGGTKEVYYDQNGIYYPYSTENNVLISYQLNLGQTGSWPSPPLTDQTQSFLAKTQGFVVMNQASTDWYELDDDGKYLQISNGSVSTYLNNEWTQGNTIFNFLGSSGPVASLESGITGLQGDYRISFLYNQYIAEALWQFWTNYKVSYYSPSFSPYITSLERNITFGQPASSYNSFYEYGLPVGTNWSIAISGPGISRLFTSNSNLIYTYLPNGTYVYTVGSYVNGSYHSGIDGRYIPSPVSGNVIVTGAFTVQYIIFSLNQVLKYDLTPEEASGQGGNITLPILVIDIQGLPAGISTIDNVIKYLNATLIAKNQNQTTLLKFTISQAKEGMIVIFLNISSRQIQEIQNGSAVVSFVSGFQLGTIEEVAAGVAGSQIFSSVSVNGPPGSNVTSKTGINTINQIIDYLAYLESQAYGRALYLILVLLAIMFYTLSISKHLKKKNKPVAK